MLLWQYGKVTDLFFGISGKTCQYPESGKKGADLDGDVVKKSLQRKRDDINNQVISGTKHTWPLVALSVRER